MLLTTICSQLSADQFINCFFFQSRTYAGFNFILLFWDMAGWETPYKSVALPFYLQRGLWTKHTWAHWTWIQSRNCNGSSYQTWSKCFSTVPLPIDCPWIFPHLYYHAFIWLLFWLSIYMLQLFWIHAFKDSFFFSG